MAAVIKRNSAKFSVHFDGLITADHHLSVRAMARTYEHVQRAIDRAYLIEKYGSVWKHARLKAEDYEHVDFMAEYPREGGIILDAVKDGAGQIIDRIASAMTQPFELAVRGGLDENAALREQLNQRRQYVRNVGHRHVESLQDLIDDPPPGWAKAYSDRSILKEIDQLTNQITPSNVEGSTVDISLSGVRARAVYGFTPEIADRFHTIVAARELGPVVRVNARIRDLDRGNKYSRPKAELESDRPA